MARKKPSRPLNSLKSNSYRVRNGKFRPVKYFGKHAGHGTYMAGTVDGQLVADSTGRPTLQIYLGVSSRESGYFFHGRSLRHLQKAYKITDNSLNFWKFKTFVHE